MPECSQYGDYWLTHSLLTHIFTQQYRGLIGHVNIYLQNTILRKSKLHLFLQNSIKFDQNL